MKIIFPLPKSPHPSGRIGNTRMQDWYRGLVIAKTLYQSDSKILILTALHIKGEKSEEEIYLDALSEFGIKRNDIIVVREGRETVGQIEEAHKLASEQGAKLIVVSTFLHYPRVLWLCRNYKEVQHKVAWGIPRPREIVTDLLLAIIFPVLDIFGLRRWFQIKVIKRRSSGKF